MKTVRLRHLARLRVEPAHGLSLVLTLDQVGSGAGRLVEEVAVRDASGSLRFEPGDVLFSKLRPYLAKSLLVKTSLAGTSEFLAMVANPRLEPRFLFYATLSRPWLDWADMTSYGSKMPRTSWDSMADFPMIDMPTDWQRRVADFLDDQVARIDRIIAARRAQLILISDWWSSYVEARMIEPGGATHELRRVLCRPPDYGANAAAEYEDPFWPRYVRTTDVTADGELRPETFRSLPPDVAANYLLVDGDVLFTRSGATVGKSFIYRESWGPAAFAGYLIRVRADLSRVLPEWIKFFSETRPYWQQISESSIQATIPNVNADKYASLRISIPDVTTQVAIARSLATEAKELRTHIATLHRSIELSEDYKRSLITAAVSGEFDVSSADGSRVPV